MNIFQKHACVFGKKTQKVVSTVPGCHRRGGGRVRRGGRRRGGINQNTNANFLIEHSGATSRARTKGLGLQHTNAICR